jgi:glycosyltransferase involved in cell wall biosynthesis
MADPVVRSLTVFFPFYNEEANIEGVVGRAVETLVRLGLDWEIILVDDGSRDRTGELADRLAAGDPRIRAIHHRPNRGYGGALQSGFRNATKEWIFYTDGDGQFDIRQIELLLPLAGRYDIVNGYRLNRQDPLIRRLNAFCWGALVKTLLKFRARDVDSAFKLYRAEIFRHIDMKSNGALIDAEILARANRAGYTIGHVGVRHLQRVAGQQTGAKLTVIVRAFAELLRLRKGILATPSVQRHAGQAAAKQP